MRTRKFASEIYWPLTWYENTREQIWIFVAKAINLKYYKSIDFVHKFVLDDGTKLITLCEITPPFKACKGNWPMKNGLPKELPNVGKKNKPVTRLKHLMKQKDDKSLAVEEKFEILKGQILSECILRNHRFSKTPPKNLIDFCPGRFYRLCT